jgi:hypothetical protein
VDYERYGVDCTGFRSRSIACVAVNESSLDVDLKPISEILNLGWGNSVYISTNWMRPRGCYLTISIVYTGMSNVTLGKKCGCINET